MNESMIAFISLHTIMLPPQNMLPLEYDFNFFYREDFIRLP